VDKDNGPSVLVRRNDLAIAERPQPLDELGDCMRSMVVPDSHGPCVHIHPSCLPSCGRTVFLYEARKILDVVDGRFGQDAVAEIEDVAGASGGLFENLFGAGL
jgi:hypothetical protein